MKFIKIILILLFISAPLSAGAEQVKSIDELAKKYSIKGCKKCHKEIYRQWENSHHSRSLMGLNDNIMLGYIKKGHLAVKKPDQSLTDIYVEGLGEYASPAPEDATEKNFPCFKCHLPQAVNQANSLYAEIAKAVLEGDKEPLRKLNINCIVCHNKMAIIHRMQDGEPDEDTMYSSKDVENKKHKKLKKWKKVAKSPIMNRPIMCGQCHGLGPNLEFENPVQCASLYGSYLNAYIPDGGSQTCQDCHMKQVGKKNEKDHRFLPDYNSKEETSAFLAESILLDVETLGYEYLAPDNKHVPMVVVNVRITNTAGHRFPDG